MYFIVFERQGRKRTWPGCSRSATAELVVGPRIRGFARQILRLVLGALGATAIIGLTIEAIQSAAEFGRLAVDPVFAGVGVARGDAHTVMVIPGFLGNDNYLDTLRGWLRPIGYTPLASGLSRNTGFKREILEHLEQRAIAASQTSGTSVSLIGHSLGGVYAPAIARRNPATVRQIVTMGSPLRLDNGRVAVPFTAVYSRADRIVRYPRALTEAGGVNVEAGGCHVGMAFNAAVYRAIAAALNASAHASASYQREV
jgi:pimeloyl-ACP methyl ester carboxylesterase